MGFEFEKKKDLKTKQKSYTNEAVFGEIPEVRSSEEISWSKRDIWE